jgi:hypothetical protein
MTGNAGTDTLIFDDSANATATTYALTDTSIARQSGPSTDYRSIERVVFRPGTGTIVTTSAQRLTSLEIAADRTVTVEQNATNNDPTGALIVDSLSIADDGVLDLKNNAMIIDYNTVGGLVQTVLQYLVSGKLVSSLSTYYVRLGYGDNNTLGLQKSSFAGQQFASGDFSQLLIGYTYGGDADLDGDVDVADLGILATNWQTVQPWTGADFDYTNSVDVADLGILATNWQLGAQSPSSETFDEAWYRIRHGG